MKVYPFFCAVALSCGVASAQTPLLHYTFNEASGDALDTGSGTAANGTLNGGAVRSANTPGGFGSSVDFTTDSPYAHVLSSDADKLDGLTQMTLTTWLNVSAYASGNVRLLSKQASSGGGITWNMNATPNDGGVGADNFKIGLFLGGAGGAGFTFGYATADVDANTISAADHWVFLAVSYDGTLASDNTSYYIGDASTSLTQLGTSVTLGQVVEESGTARFGVGFTDAAPTADVSVKGFQDDVRVYGSVLSLNDLNDVRLEAIPEPTTFAILGCGLAGLLAFRKIRKH